MHKVNNNLAPIAFHEIFTKPSHNYPTNFSYNSFSFKKCSLNSTKYSISFRGSKLWNDFRLDLTQSFQKRLNQNYLMQKTN